MTIRFQALGRAIFGMAMITGVIAPREVARSAPLMTVQPTSGEVM